MLTGAFRLKAPVGGDSCMLCRSSIRLGLSGGESHGPLSCGLQSPWHPWEEVIPSPSRIHHLPRCSHPSIIIHRA